MDSFGFGFDDDGPQRFAEQHHHSPIKHHFCDLRSIQFGGQHQYHSVFPHLSSGEHSGKLRARQTRHQVRIFSREHLLPHRHRAMLLHQSRLWLCDGRILGLHSGSAFHPQRSC